MDVALVIERVEAWRGGAETSTLQFARHLARTGCHVSLVTTTIVPSTPDLTIVPINSNPLLRGRRTSLFAQRADEYIRANRFDVVHSITPCLAADVYQPRGGTIPETLARNAAIRHGSVGRGFKRFTQAITLKNHVMADLERRLVNREPGPLVIAISDYVARQLQTHYGVDSARIRRVFNGADPDVSSFEQKRADRTQVRRQLGLADDDYVLLAVAHNFKLKGIGPLIQALRQVRPANTFAVIVGRDDPTPYARMARESGLQDRIIFTGPTQRVSAFYHAADVVVHPTYYDPCSRVVLEALGAGTPTITTRFNGAAEVIVDGTHGFVIDTPDDLPALADRIERLADPELREQCAAAAPSAVAGVTMEAHAQGVLRVYEEIIRSGGFARQGGK